MEARFDFGKNWLNYSRHLNEDRIESAKKGLAQLITPDSLAGKSFLDIGSGSGLSSLSAHLLGAKRIHSFDYDLNSVQATKTLQKQLGSTADWKVDQGSILDTQYISKLGQFDVVYSWGVLHHTGQLWKAIDQAASLVLPGGLLIIALYNDQKWISKFWYWVKRIYVNSPNFFQKLIIAGFLPFFSIRKMFGLLIKKDINPSLDRGMHFYYDVIDWVGGYPFEVASREKTIQYLEKKGFKKQLIISAGRKMGCNQFVFRAKKNY
jgi:SAM-dependent methyltransferase